MKIAPSYLILLVFSIYGCQKTFPPGTFGHDLKILQAVKNIHVLQDGDAMIAVSGEYQGRVFISTSQGMSGRSLGWFKRETILSGSADNIAGLGGESRMWFGPEAGKYSIFFDPGTEQIPENIKISHDLNEVRFEVIDHSQNQISSTGNMNIRNATGTVFQLTAFRKITLLNPSEIQTTLDVKLPEGISMVAFSAETEIRNTGKEQWKKETGLLSIWDLGCMLPAPNTWVIIPIREEADSVTSYFTELTEDRIQLTEKVLFYKADAKYLNKIGVLPRYCKNVFGSYSPELNSLNIVKYSFEDDSLYVNSQWGNDDPYAGDVINIFNGEVNEPLDRNWPFYEVETSSSAKELKPGEKMYHMQSIYHFEGAKESLDEISKHVLGVALKELEGI